MEEYSNFLLICHRLADRAGTTTQAIRIAKALANAGKRVYLMGEGKITVRGVTIFPLPKTNSPIQFLQNCREVLQKNNVEGIGIIQTFDTIYTGPSGIILAEFFNAKKVLRIGAVYEDFYSSRLVSKVNIPIYSNTRNLIKFGLTTFLKTILANYDAVFCNCNFLANHYSKMASTRIYSIPNIVDIDHPQSKKVKDQEGIKLLYVGRIEQRKNVDELIKAISKCTDGVTIEKFSIVGSGEKEPKYTKYVHKLIDQNIRENIDVNITGFLTGKELKKQFLDHDLAVFPTNDKYFPITEGMPNVVIEALGYGLPIIATAIAGVPQVMKGDLSSLLIDPNNVINEICNKIKWFDKLSEEKKFELNSLGIKRVQSFNEENFTLRYKQLLDEI